jgi:hypothetical protein
MPGSSVARLSDLREVVLSGPGVDSVGAALAGAGPGDVRQRSLTQSVVAVLVLGLWKAPG